MQEQFLRFTAVQQAVGLSRTSVWRLERAGLFPHRRQISTNRVAWKKSEIESWMDRREIAGAQL